jgi:hypothetical protein
MIISVLDNNKILIKTNEINHGKTIFFGLLREKVYNIDLIMLSI